jgi:hypothetical protein
VEPTEDQDPETYGDLSEVVRTARRGFRSDVQVLTAALPQGALLVPLARAIADVPLGEEVVPQDGEVSLIPHLLPERDGSLFVPLFTDPDILRTVGKYLEWTTEEAHGVAGGGTQTASGELQYCTLPALVALDLAQQIIDGNRVLGAVINPSDEFELLLSRNELGSIAKGQAIPLVGYVQEIPLGKDEASLISDVGAAPDPKLVAAIETCLQGLSGIHGFELRHTFNAERDLEPHPTLVLRVSDEFDVDLETLNRRLGEHVEGKLPDPGYIDVMFESAGDGK